MRWTVVVVVVVLDIFSDPLIHAYQLQRYQMGRRFRHFRELLGNAAHRIGWWVRRAADRGLGHSRTAAGLLRAGGYHIRDWVRARWKH